MGARGYMKNMLCAYCRVWLAMVFVVSATVGCGQKGGLYIPDDREEGGRVEVAAPVRV